MSRCGGVVALRSIIVSAFFILKLVHSAQAQFLDQSPMVISLPPASVPTLISNQAFSVEDWNLRDQLNAIVPSSLGESNVFQWAPFYYTDLASNTTIGGPTQSSTDGFANLGSLVWDFDQDGYPDYLSLNHKPMSSYPFPEARLYFGAGLLSFHSPMRVPASFGAISIGPYSQAVVDLNDDGIPELAICGQLNFSSQASNHVIEVIPNSITPRNPTININPMPGGFGICHKLRPYKNGNYKGLVGYNRDRQTFSFSDPTLNRVDLLLPVSNCELRDFEMLDLDSNGTDDIVMIDSLNRVWLVFLDHALSMMGLGPTQYYSHSSSTRGTFLSALMMDVTGDGIKDLHILNQLISGSELLQFIGPLGGTRTAPDAILSNLPAPIQNSSSDPYDYRFLSEDRGFTRAANQTYFSRDGARGLKIWFPRTMTSANPVASIYNAPLTARTGTGVTYAGQEQVVARLIDGEPVQGGSVTLAANGILPNQPVYALFGTQAYNPPLSIGSSRLYTQIRYWSEPVWSSTTSGSRGSSVAFRFKIPNDPSLSQTPIQIQLLTFDANHFPVGSNLVTVDIE